MNKENRKIWYLFSFGRVSGPFSSNEIKRLITAQPDPDCLIWDGVSPKWGPIEEWLNEPTDPNLIVFPVKEEKSDVWYFGFNGIQNGPFSLKDISQKVQSGEIPLMAQFWTTGLTKWVGLAELPQIVDQAGLLRRKVPRAPFVGDVEVRGFIHENHVSTVSLSEGGVGILNLLQLGPGARINLKITSKLLIEPLESQAEILYQSGMTSGLKFRDISKGTSEIIADFFKKFESGTFEVESLAEAK